MRIKATLTVTVWLDDAESEQEVRDQLTWAADHMSGAGMLTGDGPATVDTWEAVVTTEEVR